MFLDDYNEYYKDNKKVPLAIEVPIAYVVTNGATCIDYSSEYLNNVSDFATDKTAYDED